MLLIDARLVAISPSATVSLASIASDSPCISLTAPASVAEVVSRAVPSPVKVCRESTSPSAVVSLVSRAPSAAIARSSAVLIAVSSFLSASFSEVPADR
jgi:hypothetical protein